MPEPRAPAASEGARIIPGGPGRAIPIAAGTLALGFVYVVMTDRTFLGLLHPWWAVDLEIAVIIAILATVVGLLYVLGRSVVELRGDTIVVRRAFRTVRVPWESVIRYQCDPTFAEMALVFAAEDRRGRRRAAAVTVSERQARVILADPRSEWVPVEGRFTFRLAA